MTPRTLILHHGALGDCMLLAPLMRGLLSQGHQLTLGQSHDKARLMQRVLPDIAVVDIETPAWAMLLQPGMTADATVAAILRDAQNIITFLSHGDDAWALNVRKIAPLAQLHFLQTRSLPDEQPAHLTACHRSQLAAQSLQVSLKQAPLRQRGGLPVMIHPGSGGKAKCWPRDRWESLLQDPALSHLRLTALLGEVELETWDSAVIARWMKQYGAIACHTLDELYDHLSHARGLAAADCGPAHLAAAMGLPVLSLFGPTCPVTWSPAAARGCLIAPASLQPMDWLTVAHVKREMLDFFEKSTTVP